MHSVKSLHAQQKKWNVGGLQMLREYPIQTFRYLYDHVTMAGNLVTRLLFVSLVAASLSIGAFQFSYIWLIPVICSVLLNLTVVSAMKNRTGTDYFWAWAILPAEIYLVFKSILCQFKPWNPGRSVSSPVSR